MLNDDYRILLVYKKETHFYEEWAPALAGKNVCLTSFHLINL